MGTISKMSFIFLQGKTCLYDAVLLASLEIQNLAVIKQQALDDER